MVKIDWFKRILGMTKTPVRRGRRRHRAALPVSALVQTLETRVMPTVTVGLADTTTTLSESTNTSSAVKVADVLAVDSQSNGRHSLTLSGADASLFQLQTDTSGVTSLYLKPGANLDFETNPVLDVTVNYQRGNGRGGMKASANLSIQLTDVNDTTPVLTANTLTISEGGTVTLTAANLNATDADTTGEPLTFTVSNVTNGQFELVADPGTAVTSFSLAQVLGGQVQFVHNGSESAPSYDVSVSDGVNTSAASAATILFTNLNDAPILTANSLSLNQGDTVVLTTSDLNATDAEGDPLSFSVSNVTHGQFELVADAGVAITSFIFDQVVNGQVQFVHDNTTAAPTYSVSVTDGTTTTAAAAATITFNGVTSHPPVFTANSLTIDEGGTVVLTTSDLNATDEDGDTLNFTVSNVTNGQFELVSNPGVAITSFSLAQVTNGEVQFVHNGGEAAPGYDVTVSDGTNATTQAATITFNNVNDQVPVLTANTLTIGSGSTAVLTTANLNATDADLPGDTLTFNVSNVTNGQFELVSNPGIAVTSFTLDQVSNGDVQFVSNHSGLAPSYDVSVSDGVNSTTATAATINFWTSTAPTLNLRSRNVTVRHGRAAARIAPTATVSDSDSANFNGGTLTVGFSSGADAGDVLSIQNVGTRRNQIGIDGNVVTYGGVAIGTFTGGTAGNPLVITFNDQATPQAVQQLLRSITFASTSTLAVPSRSLEVTLNDGAGGITSAMTNVTVR